MSIGRAIIRPRTKYYPPNPLPLIIQNTTMPVHRRRFTTEEKLGILQEAKQLGTTAALRKHNLSYSVFHRWKESMIENGKGEGKSLYSQLHVKLKDLIEENSLLKKIIANQAMLLELKEEEIKNRKVK
jgi:putative transposase